MYIYCMHHVIRNSIKSSATYFADGLFQGKLKVCKVPGGGGPTFFRVRGVQLLISMKTYITCDFPGGGGPEPLSSSGSAHVSSPFTYPRMFSLSMTICKKSPHVIKCFIFGDWS